MIDSLNRNVIPLHRKAIYSLLFLFGCLFLTIVIGNHYFFRTTSFDYAVYNFAFWDYAHFHLSSIPSCRVFGGVEMNFLQDHFSFTLMYFVPVYWLINWLTGSYTLLIILVALILWSGWAIYKLILLKTGDGWLGVAAVLYYFLLQGRYSAFAADSNICTMVSCFVPLFLYYFESKKYVSAGVIFILSLFSREDMPLWFAFIFVVLIIWHWKEKKLVFQCLFYIAACIIYFVLLFRVFIPSVETPEKHYALFNYTALGKGPWEALLFIIEHPLHSLKLLFVNPLPDHTFDGVKKEFYLVYLISGGFMLFCRPIYFIWFIPLIAQKMYNDEPVRWSIQYYYSIPVVTMLPISVFIIVSKFKIRWKRYGVALLICLFTIGVTAYKMKAERRKIPWWTTVKENPLNPKFFHPEYRTSAIHSHLNLIPDNARVCASASLLPHLAQRPFAYQFPDVEDADFLAVFAFKDYYIINEEQYQNELNKYIYSPSWVLLNSDSYPFLLFCKDSYKINPAISGIKLDSISCLANTLNKEGNKLVASNGDSVDNADARDTMIRHKGNFTIHLNSVKKYGFTWHCKNISPGDFLKISVWKYPVVEGKGNLVVSCGKNFYQATATCERTDNSGWGEIVLYLRVPEDTSNFNVYSWNNGDNDIWFDNLKIVRRK